MKRINRCRWCGGPLVTRSAGDFKWAHRDYVTQVGSPRVYCPDGVNTARPIIEREQKVLM